MAQSPELTEMTAEIVSAFVSNSSVRPSELPELIRQVHTTLSGIATGASAEPAPAPLTPAVSIKKSISPDYLTCLEDGRKFKSLKRHLRTKYGLSPEAYRKKWGLPKDYPMVAPNYAAARSSLAKQMGLGQARKAPSPAPVAKPTRGRKPKAS